MTPTLVFGAFPELEEVPIPLSVALQMKDPG